MEITMIEEILQKLGLSTGETMVYQFLLKNGESTAGEIIQGVKLKRGNTYNILKDLVSYGLVEQFEKNKVMNFRLEHPSRLREYLEQKTREAEQVKGALDLALPQLISNFNLSHYKPTFHYFEGEEGVRKVLEDSLTSKTEIYSYADIESIVKYIDDVNQWYAKKRDGLEIKKRGIMIDTPFARKYLENYHREVTTTKLIKFKAKPFESIMQIYDGKVSYITLSSERLIGVIIEDKSIYEMHKDLFEYLWGVTPDLAV